MSIASEITRLQNAKASIKTSIEAKGVTVPSSAKLDTYSNYVDQIQTGGGGSEERIAKLINNQLTSLIPSDFTGGNLYPTPFINSYTFKNKTSITSITFPQIIGQIYSQAFAGCTGLTSFTAPICTQFDVNVLANCKNLQTIDLSNCNNLNGFTYFDTTQSSAPSSTDGFINLTSITFPEVGTYFYTSVSQYGLANTTSLTSITLPGLKSGQTMTSNNAKGYLYNSGIGSAYVSDGVNYIAESMFEHCQNLTSVSLPAGLVNIDIKAFKDCPLLTSLTFRGTMAQWGNVTLGGGWRQNSPITTIHCSDGDASIPLVPDIHWNNYVINDYAWSLYNNTTVNGGKVWWNGEALQCDNKEYNSSTDSWTSRTNTRLNVWYHNGNYYNIAGSNQIEKYDATASHAGTADVWTTLNIHTPYSTATYVCEIDGNVYYLYQGKGYKWLGENDGFATTETFNVSSSDFNGWNVWSPDGQHYFLTGGTTSTSGKKNFLWDSTNETFVAWNDMAMQVQGMGFFNYNNTLYYAQYNSKKIYNVSIDYNNHTITLTESSDFTGVPSLTTGPDKFWDYDGTRVLSAVGLRPRHTN